MKPNIVFESIPAWGSPRGFLWRQDISTTTTTTNHALPPPHRAAVWLE
jgi:hypothetical protein